MWAINYKSRKRTLHMQHTRLVIHCTVWLKSYSHCRLLHMASFCIAAEWRQTHNIKPNAGYQYNTNYNMQRESKQTILTANTFSDNGNLLVAPPCGRITTRLLPYVRTAPLLKQYTKAFVELAINDYLNSIKPQLCLRGFSDFP